MKILRKFLLMLGILSIIFVEGCTSNKTGKKSNNSQAQVSKVLVNKKFSDLKIVSKNADVNIEIGKNYRITYHGKKFTVPKISSKKEKVEIKQVKSSHSLGAMRIPRIIVTVPKKEYLNKLNITSDDADIRISNLYLKTGDVETSDGDISLTDSHLTHGMKLSSLTGNITVKNTKFTGYKLTTREGQIQFKHHSANSSYAKKVKSKNVLTAHSGSREVWIK